jgi:hypothetical protein
MYVGPLWARVNLKYGIIIFSNSKHTYLWKLICSLFFSQKGRPLDAFPRQRTRNATIEELLETVFSTG